MTTTGPGVVGRITELAAHSPAHAIAAAEINRETIGAQQKHIGNLDELLEATRDYAVAIARLFRECEFELVWRCPDIFDRYIRGLKVEEYAQCFEEVLAGNLPRWHCTATGCSAGAECGGAYVCKEAAKDERDAETKFITRAPQYFVNAYDRWKAALKKAGEVDRG